MSLFLECVVREDTDTHTDTHTDTERHTQTQRAPKRHPERHRKTQRDTVTRRHRDHRVTPKKVDGRQVEQNFCGDLSAAVLT